VKRAAKPAEAAPPLPFSRSVGFLVRDLNRAIQRSLQQKIAPYGVPPGAWYFLRVLWEEEGLTQRELAARVGMMEPTAAVALRGLERAGWIRRTRSPADRRKIHITLTPAGRALRERLLPLAHAVNAEACRGMTEAEKETFLSLLARARANLEGG
jgi:DNA-binding MarR family transcriptional regulator